MSICICQIINNEHPYIEEWIEYHHSLGVEKFYLIEDFNSKSHKEILEKYDYVELYPLLDIINEEERKRFEDGEFRQRIVYRVFLRLWADKHDYMAFIDVDEFIDATKEQLQELLIEGMNYATICLTWKIMSSEGHIKHPNNGKKYSVLETYKNYNFSIKHHKQIINCAKKFRKDIANKFYDFPHNFKGVKTLDKKIYLKHFLYKSFEEYFIRLTNRGEMTLDYPRKFDDWFKGIPEMLPQKEDIYKLFNVNENTVKLNLMYEKRKSVICAIIKNEQRFIREWVEHYLNIGFNKLYIFEDYGSDSHREQLVDLIEDDKVELNNLEETIFVPNKAGFCAVQVPLYCRFFDMCKKKEIEADWVGFFDADEFLMFEDGWDLNRLEEEFKNYGGVLLSWLMYGANGHIKRPEGNVVDNYTSHLPKNTYIDGAPQWNHKSLVNIKVSNGLITNHTFEGCVHTNGNGDYVHSSQIYEKAWINHYFTKSWEDYCDRMFNRGNMRNNSRCFDCFFFLSPEFQDRKIEMLESVRHMKTEGTMWISHKQRIISGGNMKRLEKLRKGL